MKKTIKIFSIFLILMCFACSQQNNAKLNDGIYQAMTNVLDEGGCQDFVEFKVENEKITTFTYDGVNLQSGSKQLKSEAAKNGKYTMNSANGEWDEQAKTISSYIIENQTLDSIDSISGATISLDTLNLLINDALNNGPIKNGSLGDGIYYSKTKEADDNDNIYTLGYYVKNGLIIGAHVDSYNNTKENIEYNYNLAIDGNYDLKSSTATFNQQCVNIANYIVKNQTIALNSDEKVDALASVTIKVSSWVELFDELSK